MDAEAFQVVNRIIERRDFDLAAVARTGVDLTNGKRAAKCFMYGCADSSVRERAG